MAYENGYVKNHVPKQTNTAMTLRFNVYWKMEIISYEFLIVSYKLYVRIETYNVKCFLQSLTNS
jgi:hypothetical protein